MAATSAQLDHELTPVADERPGRHDLKKGGPVEMEKGFLAALFDFSFRSFITTKIVPVIYVLATIFYGVLALFVLLAGVRHGLGVLIGLIAAPLLFLFGMISCCSASREAPPASPVQALLPARTPALPPRSRQGQVHEVYTAEA